MEGPLWLFSLAGPLASNGIPGGGAEDPPTGKVVSDHHASPLPFSPGLIFDSGPAKETSTSRGGNRRSWCIAMDLARKRGRPGHLFGRFARDWEALAPRTEIGKTLSRRVRGRCRTTGPFFLYVAENLDDSMAVVELASGHVVQGVSATGPCISPTALWFGSLTARSTCRRGAVYEVACGSGQWGPADSKRKTPRSMWGRSHPSGPLLL